MIKRVNLLVLQAVADKLPPRTKEIVEDAIHEIAEWRSAMRRINEAAFDALTEPMELQHFPGGGFQPKPKRFLMGEGSEMPTSDTHPARTPSPTT